MKEPYNEGIASRIGPESCVGVRKGAGEALTGESTGWVSSRENILNRGADAFPSVGRQHRLHCYRKMQADPARSQTPCMCGRFLRRSWEVPYPTAAGVAAARVVNLFRAIRR